MVISSIKRYMFGSCLPVASNAIQVTLAEVYSRGLMFSGKGCTIPNGGSPKRKKNNFISIKLLKMLIY